MLQWFQRLMPRQDAFFPAFERRAAVIVKAAVALRANHHHCRSYLPVFFASCF